MSQIFDARKRTLLFCRLFLSCPQGKDVALPLPAWLEPLAAGALVLRLNSPLKAAAPKEAPKPGLGKVRRSRKAKDAGPANSQAPAVGASGFVRPLYSSETDAKTLNGSFSTTGRGLLRLRGGVLCDEIFEVRGPKRVGSFCHFITPREWLDERPAFQKKETRWSSRDKSLPPFGWR